jgi:hypothetical protein
MFHCHNLIHEDHEMLAEFNVTEPPDFPTDEVQFFVDPLDPRFRDVPFNEVEFETNTGNFSEPAIQARVQAYAANRPYPDVARIDAELEAFWTAKTAKEKRDGKFEHYGMSAAERRDRLNGWYAPDMTGYKAKEKRRPRPVEVKFPGPHGFAHLGMI